MSRSRLKWFCFATALTVGCVVFAAESFAQKNVAVGEQLVPMSSRVPPLNLKIVRFCERCVGQKIGSGECAVLASTALKENGGTPRVDLPLPMSPMVEDDYVWGRLLKSNVQILPGDILQFRDVMFKYVYEDGGTRTQRMPRHTAIVYKVLGEGRLTLLHQNMAHQDATEEERRRVRVDEIDLRALQAGTIWAYRPVPAPE